MPFSSLGDCTVEELQQEVDELRAKLLRREAHLQRHVESWAHIQAALAPDDDAAQIALAVHGNPPRPPAESLAGQVIAALEAAKEDK